MAAALDTRRIGRRTPSRPEATVTRPTTDVVGEQLRLDVHELVRPGGLLDTLEALVPEQVGDPSVGRLSRRLAHSAPPWHTEAAETLMLIHTGARDTEAKLAYLVLHIRRRRGSSWANTRHALEAIPDLATRAGRPHDDHARREVELWIRMARQLRDVDQQERWATLPRQPGHIPPPCPYCGTYALRWSPTSGNVRCTNTDCVDEGGHRPKATMRQGRYSGQAALVWRDGREICYDRGEP